MSTFQASRTSRAPTQTAPAAGCAKTVQHLPVFVQSGQVGRGPAAPRRRRERLETAAPQRGERAPGRTRSLCVEVDRHPHGGDARPHAASHSRGILHSHALHGHEGEHVQGAHPRVDALVFAHVDAVQREPRGRHGAGLHRTGRPDRRDHRAMVIRVHGGMEDLAPGAHEGVLDRRHEPPVPSLAEIGNRLEH